MRMTLFICLACCLSVAAKTSSQNITFTKKDATLKEIFSEIRKQTNYGVFYNQGLINDNLKVSVNATQKSLGEFMEQVLKNLPVDFLIEGQTIVISEKKSHAVTALNSSSLGNTGEIPGIMRRGIVTDADSHEPMVGVNITVKGKKRGATTDLTGRYEINTEEEDVLLFSYVGYTTKEVKVGGRKIIDVQMQSSEGELEDVVISTGIFKKNDKVFTGSSITVTAEELQSFGSRNMIVSLANIDPSFRIIENNMQGSDPNRLPDIQIRGNSSLPNINNLDDLAGLNTPLIIVNSFQSSLQKMLDMNVNEVESITILKDAAATAIYGSRGANGVIVITTKLPKPGTFRLDYRADMNLEVADLSDYRLLGARQKLELEREVGLYNNSVIDYDLGLKRYYNEILNDVNAGVNTNWLEIPLRTGVGQRHNISLSGGVESFRYSASLQINNIQGVMKASERNTLNGTVNLAYVFKGLKFNNQTMISEGRSSESNYGVFSDYVSKNPYWSPYDEAGNVLKVLGEPKTAGYTQIRWVPNLPVNPLYNASLNVFDKAKNAEITNNSSVEWMVIPGLVMRAQLGIIKLTRQTDRFRPADHTAFADYSSADIFRKGDYNYSITNGFSYDAGFNVQYAATFHSKHQLFTGLDFNIRKNQQSSYGFLAEGFTSPVMDFISMALQYGRDQKPTGSESLVHAIGTTANINYNFDDRYFTDLSMRMDGSSQFGANNRMAPFYAVGFGWNLHNEAFLKNNTLIERLKLRGSVGITGSQNFNAYQALSTYRYYTDKRYFNMNGAYLLGIGNEDLKWQQSLKKNIGFDAEFLRRRLRLTVDYYLETTRDLVSSISIPASNGFTSYVENIGRLRNQGFEMRATAVLVDEPAKSWYWSITAGAAQNRNKIVEISQAMKDAQKGRQMATGTVPSALYYEGYSTNAIWVVPSLGIDPSNGREVYLDINGKPTYVWSGNNLRAMGNTDPDLMGNFSTLVRYKGFSLNASFGYHFGGQNYNQTLINRVENADYKYNVDERVYNNRWIKPGDKVFFKGVLETGTTYKSSRFVQDNNTLICQNINLQYWLQSKLLKQKLGVQHMQIAGNLAEPFRITSIKQERGISYPFSKQYALSLGVTF